MSRRGGHRAKSRPSLPGLPGGRPFAAGRPLISFYPMGYIIAAVVVIAGIVLVSFLLSSRSPRARGRIAAADARTVERSEPSADEPTPAASATADDDTARRAQRRTPPS